jgi:predicted DsbA family dithiol-disulfide isomerase
MIIADVIEVQEFPELAQLYAVRAVPKTVINNIAQILGAVPEETFVAKVLEMGQKEASEKRLQQPEEAQGMTTRLKE